MHLSFEFPKRGELSKNLIEIPGITYDQKSDEITSWCLRDRLDEVFISTKSKIVQYLSDEDLQNIAFALFFFNL